MSQIVNIFRWLSDSYTVNSVVLCLVIVQQVNTPTKQMQQKTYTCYPRQYR